MTSIELPFDSSPQELDDELMFQHVMRDTLDPGSDDYEARRDEVERNIQDLQRRLDQAAAASSHPSYPAHHAPAGPASMDGMDNSWPSVWDPLPNGHSSSQGSANRNLYRGIAFPYSSAMTGDKRGYPGSLTNDPCEQPSKRLTPDPSASTTPSSSLSSFELVERPSMNPTARARHRQVEAEERIRRQNADEAMARSIQHSHANTLLSSSRPPVQTTIGASGHFQRPPPPPPTKAESNSSPVPNGFRPPSATLHSNAPLSYGMSPHKSHLKSEFSKAGPSSATHLQARRPARTAVVDLTASDDEDDLTEIAPIGFTSNSRTPKPPPSRTSYRAPHTMPGSYPNVNESGNDSALWGKRLSQSVSSASSGIQHNVADPLAQLNRLVYGSSTQSPLHGYEASVAHLGPGYDSHGRPRVSTAGHSLYPSSKSSAGVGSTRMPPLLDSWSFADQITSLVGAGTSELPYGLDDDDEDDDVANLFGLPRRPGLYAGKDDLYRNRYDAIANYDPQQTKEEINTLLNNIRPDEDMPAHLRVQTPPGMAVKLHKYQELGLTWLKKCEEGSNKGGILADDMGLGKTIQMLSLIVSNRSDDPGCRQTLVIAPVALMRQWKSEIQTKIRPGSHALKVFTHHGSQKKNSFADFQQYDVVLTTFGSLASELKKSETFRLRQNHDPEARPSPKEKCVLLGPESKWFRVILDEAQCIKNKNTLTAKAARMLNARYRFCVTGTPMMNNVEELYSLIAFLRMKPYSAWDKFRLDFSLPLKSSDEREKNNAMQKFQAVCKAIMLRRTKKSTYEGKPILILPDRTTEIDHPTFSDDEKNFYDSLEGKTQLQFNKYLKAGTVGKSYSAILVLLLRLRQACCHPHLIKDFGVAATADVTPDTMLELAKTLEGQVVARIREKDGSFDCPVCYDATVNPAIFIPCGHDTCSDCFARITDPAMALAAGHENGGGQAKCPECRGTVDPKRITDYQSFKKVHQREKLTQDELELEAGVGVADEEDDDTDSDSASDDEESEDDQGNLDGFIVPDDTVEYDDSSDKKVVNFDSRQDESTIKVKDEAAAGSSTEKPKSKRKSTKGKAKSKPKETLAELKKKAGRSVKAKKAYLRRLRRNWISSAKIDKTLSILRKIMNETDEKVLIFSQWTSLLDLLEVPVDREGWGYRRYDGSMNAAARGDAVEDFSDARKNVRIMLVSLKAGNAGLNLNTASQVIILDPFWNPYIEEQAIDRAHRIGQTREVKVHRVLVEGTVEDRILELQEKKRALISTALDEKAAQGIARLGVQELAFLFGVTANPQQQIDYVPRNAR